MILNDRSPSVKGYAAFSTDDFATLRDLDRTHPCHLPHAEVFTVLKQLCHSAKPTPVDLRGRAS